MAATRPESPEVPPPGGRDRGESGRRTTRYYLPPEWIVAVLFTCVFAAGLAAGLPTNIPDAASISFIITHYFRPLLYAGLLKMALTLLAGWRNRTDRFLMLKLLPLVVLSVFLHFNFKAWMPLIHPVSFDPEFRRTGEALEPVLSLFLAVRSAVAANSPVNVDPLYHTLFVGMFFASIATHALFDRPDRQRRLVLGMCLILLLGGMAYWVAPAVGPFLYRGGMNQLSAECQQAMLANFRVVMGTGRFPPGYFAGPLAAMPSLHVAHALFLTLYAWRLSRWLGAVYLPILAWVVVESVASGWHYLIDLPAGALLALACLALARRLIPGPPAAAACDRGPTPNAQELSFSAPAKGGRAANAVGSLGRIRMPRVLTLRRRRSIPVATVQHL